MTYHIADEPHETTLAAYVVNPTAPLIAGMMAGAWLSWPWFIFNAIAMGSPTKKKEIALSIGAFLVTGVLAWVLIALVEHEIIVSRMLIRFGVLAIVTFKLTITYYISTVQGRTFHVYQYYGGNVRAHGAILSAGYLLRGFVVGLSDDPLWIIIVAGGI